MRDGACLFMYGIYISVVAVGPYYAVHKVKVKIG